jgi:adenylate cyclase, class 2
MAIETEKKYRLDKKLLVEFTTKLRQLNAVFAYETFEENYLHRGGLLDDRNAVLRLRKTADKTLLTYKEKVGSGIESEFKHKIEFETTVGDVGATESIIEKLGYKLSVVYEKHRKAWHLGNVEVVLDELPFGLYMEIEGSMDDILAAEKLIGADRLEPEARGYPRLTVKYGNQVNGVMEARFEKTAVV